MREQPPDPAAGRPPRAHRLAEMTWPEAAALDPERTVAILPVGAVEAHGPHLPLVTDGVIALAMADEAARRLAAGGWAPLVLPPLHYTAAPFAAGFAGTVSVHPETVTALVEEIAAALAGRVRCLAIANAHLDPAHLAALTAAAEAICARGGAGGWPAIAFPDLTRRRWAGRLGEEFASGACHAGRYEGSIVLVALPGLVRAEAGRALPPNPVSLSRAIRAGLTSFEEAGGPRAYFGDPAAASAEEGRERIAELGRILEEAVLETAGAAGEDGEPSERAPAVPAERERR